jgi:hypothetical protein
MQSLRKGKTANCDSLFGKNHQFLNENQLSPMALTLLKSLFFDGA